MLGGPKARAKTKAQGRAALQSKRKRRDEPADCAKALDDDSDALLEDACEASAELVPAAEELAQPQEQPQELVQPGQPAQPAQIAQPAQPAPLAQPPLDPHVDPKPVQIVPRVDSEGHSSVVRHVLPWLRNVMMSSEWGPREPRAQVRKALALVDSAGHRFWGSYLTYSRKRTVEDVVLQFYFDDVKRML